MIINGRDLGPMIPIVIPTAGYRWQPHTYRGWRVSKHFVLFQNPRKEDAWTIANSHGNITYGFETPEIAVELALALENTGENWARHFSTASDYTQIDKIEAIRDIFKPLATTVH